MNDNGIYTGINEPEQEIQQEVAEQVETKHVLKASEKKIKAIIENEKTAVANILDLPALKDCNMDVEVEARRRYINFLNILLGQFDDIA
jgi:uncharacterized protein involved in tolerance to divalent cations